MTEAEETSVRPISAAFKWLAERFGLEVVREHVAFRLSTGAGSSEYIRVEGEWGPASPYATSYNFIISRIVAVYSDGAEEEIGLQAIKLFAACAGHLGAMGFLFFSTSDLMESGGVLEVMDVQNMDAPSS